jgi:hypothetical protein
MILNGFILNSIIIIIIIIILLTLLLGLLKQHLECLLIHYTEEMEMADFERKSPISEFLNLFQLGINASMCVRENMLENYGA